jgi:hypothetical protein
MALTVDSLRFIENKPSANMQIYNRSSEAFNFFGDAFSRSNSNTSTAGRDSLHRPSPVRRDG